MGKVGDDCKPMLGVFAVIDRRHILQQYYNR